MLRASQPIRLRKKAMQGLRLRVYIRDEKRCRECGKPLTWEQAELAHIIDRSKGGSDTEDNTRILCHRCHMTEHSNGAGLRFMHM